MRVYIYTFCLSFHRLFYLPATCSSHLLMLPPPTNTKDIGIEMPTAGWGMGWWWGCYSFGVPWEASGSRPKFKCRVSLSNVQGLYKNADSVCRQYCVG